MSRPIPAFPLQWPAGWQRTKPGNRKAAQFGRQKRSTSGNWNTRTQLTISDAVERVRAELQRMDVHDDDLIISTNLTLRLDGLPRSGQAEPIDPGAAVYWTDRADSSRPPRCMAIDRYDRVADNLAAIAATLNAMRAIERHGGAEILDRAFTGFTALPGGASEAWWDVLEVRRDASHEAIDAAYRRKRSETHPDKGGDPEQFQRVQRAYAAATQGGAT